MRSTVVVQLTAVIAATMFVATACASSGRSTDNPASGDQPAVLLCQGNKVPLQSLENPRPASELTPDAAPALDGRDVSDFHPLEWLIAEESSDRVMLMNKLAVASDDGHGDIREYEYIVISTESMPAGPGESEWAVVESSTCSPTLDLGELSAAAVSLDPSLPPSPGSDRIALLVTEFECNSGQDADGRIEVVELAETGSTVELVIGVRASGAQMASCQGNPATPFTVDLERPLGNRVILNASVVPAREITTAALP
jgi:hypothetical protein